MDITSYEELYNEILTDVQAALSTDDSFNESLAAVKVKIAIKDVKERRNYQATTLSDADIYNDLANHYYSAIFNLAMYDYNQSGAEGEETHNENSVNRTWVKRDDILREVHSFVGIIL